MGGTATAQAIGMQSGAMQAVGMQRGAVHFDGGICAFAVLAVFILAFACAFLYAFTLYQLAWAPPESGLQQLVYMWHVSSPDRFFVVAVFTQLIFMVFLTMWFKAQKQPPIGTVLLYAGLVGNIP